MLENGGTSGIEELILITDRFPGAISASRLSLPRVLTRLG